MTSGATTTRAATDARPAQVGRHFRVSIRSLVIVVAVAGLVRSVGFLAPGRLTGVVEYDDGVYYAAADALVHGRLPYADFVFLHPPGVVLLVAPFALLGDVIGDRAALATVRLAVVGVGMVNAVLVAWLAGRCRGQLAAIVAGLGYALAAGTVLTERTLLLEPLLNLCTLAAAVALFGSRLTPRRAAAAGALLGAGVTVKVWGLWHLLAALVVLGRRVTRRLAGPLLLGAGATVALLAGVFFVAAPAAMVEQVGWIQLSRPDAGIPGTWSRLADLLGLRPAWWGLFLAGPVPSAVVLPVAVVAAVGLGVAVVRGRPVERYLAVVAVLAVPAFLLGAPYYPHYAAAVIPTGAVLLGSAADLAWRRVRSTDRAGTLRPLLLAVAVVLAGSQLAASVRAAEPAPDYTASQRRLAVAADCVFTADNPSLAVAAGDLPVDRPDCPRWVDPRGVALTMLDGRRPDSFYPGGFTTLPGFQSELRRRMSRADVALVQYDPRRHPTWSSATRRYFLSRFVPAEQGGDLTVWRRAGADQLES